MSKLFTNATLVLADRLLPNGWLLEDGGKILRYGVPSGVQSMLNILSFVIFVFRTGKVGDLAFAVSNAAFTVNYLLIAPIEGIAIGAGVLVGQHQGRVIRTERSRAGTGRLCSANCM